MLLNAFFKQKFKQIFTHDELLWQNTDCSVMLLCFVKNSRIKAWVLCWCRTKEIVICYLLVLVKWKEAQFSEVIEIIVRRFLLVAALKFVTV